MGMGTAMRLRGAAALAAGAIMIAAGGLDAAGANEVIISIDKSTQSMSVLIDGVERHRWVVSTGLGGGPHDGSYKAGRMERKWFSRKYNMAPMPYSIFFDGNYAIHGTYHIKQLGRRASKGCVRLHPENAAKLFELVRTHHASTRVVVSSTMHVAARVPPAAEPAIAAPAPEIPAAMTPAPVATATATPETATPAAVTPASVAMPAVAAAAEAAKPVPEPAPAASEETASVPVPIPAQQASDTGAETSSLE